MVGDKMSRQLILAIDQGTTGTTALLLDSALQVCAKATVEFEQIFPKPGWVEHRAEDIWRSLREAVLKCLETAKASSCDIASIGITNQRETTGLFTPDGELVHNFIVWQCRRSASICEKLKGDGHEDLVRKKTGLVLDPYFSATKLMWLFQKHPEFAKQAKDGKLFFGTIDTWLVKRMSGSRAHVTDATNASRTLLFDLEKGSWSESMLELFGIPAACLPEVRTSSEIYARTKGLDFLEDGIPIAGIAGDQQAALLGQACLNQGEAKVTFGTGAFVLMHTGGERIFSQHGLLSSVALSLRGRLTYCLEGSAFAAGAAVQWLRDGLNLITSADEVEALALQVPNCGEAYFVPAFSGLGAPYWRPDARAVLCGVSRGTTKAHVARATLEGIAFQNADIIEAMQKDGVTLKQLKVDGGAAKNSLLLQMQADFLNVPCLRPANVEATALGAAFLAGLGVGLFASVQELVAAWQPDHAFQPQLLAKDREDRIAKWRNAVAKA